MTDAYLFLLPTAVCRLKTDPKVSLSSELRVRVGRVGRCGVDRRCLGAFEVPEYS